MVTNPFADVVPPTLLDRLIGHVAPTYGIRRHQARQILTRAYLAAAPGDKWRPRRATASANTDHQADAAALRAKSRFLIQNVDYIAAGMRWRSAVKVGTGIIPKWSGRDAKALHKLWTEWAPTADADGVRDVYGLQRDADNTVDRDGEALIRIRPRRSDDGLAVPVQFQLLEVDWLDNVRQSGDNGNDVIGGKEYDALGRVVAYWLWKRHPGDIGKLRNYKGESERVLAERIIHLYAPDRPGAGRGFPRLAPVITRARDLQLLEDSELARKNLEGRLSVIASGNVAALANPAQDNLTGTADLGKIASGGITRIDGGMDLTVIEPKAAPGFVDYCKHNTHLICAGAGFSYEGATGDMSGVNFSSARIRQLDLKREIQQEQWLTLIPQLCRRMVTVFATYAALSGKLGSITPSYTVDHCPPKWDYVNPNDEVDADLAEIAGGLSSISGKLRSRGEDPEVVFDELEQDIKGLQRRGIWEALAFLLKGSTPTDPSAAQPAVAKKPAKD